LTCDCCGAPPEECQCYAFPGWGSVLRVRLPTTVGSEPSPAKLGTLQATALCGNDITSSCLYVSALAALYAGPLAPIALAAVAGVLFLFRWVYAEVGTALPLNGGAYNLILNSSRKPFAAVAAALTVLSYMATAVISGSEAMHYAARLIEGLPVVPATAALLGGFALLAILGMSESAIVAVVIFCAHITTLVGLSVLGVLALLLDPAVLWANITLAPSQWPTPSSSITVALFFGFSAGMLGISGFESSANFIEEQADGVFPKTLRNMWIAVAVFNPLIALLAVGLLPLESVAADKEALLATLAARAPQILGLHGLSTWAAWWVSIDAVVVLCGAVLTSFVGVTGLLRRMALDLILPSVLLRQNSRGTNHWIVLSFLALCTSVLVFTGGRLESLASVYTLSFLSVMVLFAGGNLLLKFRRPALPRPIRAHPAVVLVALASVLLGLIGNMLLEPNGVATFAVYGAAAGAVVMVGYFRNTLLAAFLRWTSPLYGTRLRAIATRWLHDHACRQLLYITTTPEQAELEAVVRYVLANEPIRHLKIVCFGEPSGSLVQRVHKLDHEYPALRLDLVAADGAHDGPSIRNLAEVLGVPLHHVFLSGHGTPALSKLPGVRLIY